MRIQVSTPAYGGMIHHGYFRSFFETVVEASALGWGMGTFILGNESLISRGRNTAAAKFLQSNSDKLFFIDADISWDWIDFKRVVESSKLIIGGACPVKKYPISLNFNVFKEDQGLFSGEARSVGEFQALAKKYNNLDIPVRHLGTAFLCIDRSVLEALKDHVPKYQDTTLGENTECWDFFPVGVAEDPPVYLSEDWGFCALAEKHGFRTHMRPDVIVKHSGTHLFEAQL